MNSRKKVIIVGIMLLLLIVLSIICFFLPKLEIDLIGDKSVILNIGDEYQDAGATAYLKTIFQKKPLDVKVYNNINSEKSGKYVITYKAKYEWLEKEIVRIVYVADFEGPVLAINGDIKYCENSNLVEINVSAIDNVDGNISDKVKYRVDDSKIFISILDSSNNESEVIKELIPMDNEKPIISLKGDSTIYLNLGDSYIEQGATANDSCDGDLTKKISIESNVNTSVKGKYEVIYKVIDSVGKVTSIKRNVVVTDKSTSKYNIVNGATIYLTFDDGPGGYTDQILSVLDKYNVKATFFVTNQFPKYQYLIKKEYERGHTIGIHTYSHKWTVYSSVDAYLEDFNKIRQIIIDQTGYYPKYFRFPGGSSNTVSRNYSKGIMTELAKTMQEQGYVYFDWTFDSGDTSKNNNSKEDILKNFKNNLKGDGEYIVLMHDIKKNTLEALEDVINYGLSNGYKFKAIDDYTSVPHLKIAN